MEKLGPVLSDLVIAIGTWITAHAEEIVKQFFKFLDWVTTNAEKVVTMVTPAAVQMMVAITDAMVNQAPDLIQKLADGILAAVQQNPQAWAKVGEFMIAAMFGPFGIASAVIIEYLKSKSGGMVQPPLSGQPPGAIPKRGAGDSYWRGGLVEVGEAGAELIRTASNQLMLATRPMLLNLGRGSQIFNASQTRAMLPNPASPSQIHNMYQSAGPSYSNVNSNNSSNNFNLNANMPVDLSNALQRYYRQQQFLYGR
jgi:hypothetical protein